MPKQNVKTVVTLTDKVLQSMDQVVGMYLNDERRHLEEWAAEERGGENACSYTTLRRICPSHVFWALDRLALPDLQTPLKLRNAIKKVIAVYYDDEKRSYEETATLTGYDDEGNYAIFDVSFDPEQAGRSVELVREHSSAVQRSHIFYHLLVLAEAVGINK